MLKVTVLVLTVNPLLQKELEKILIALFYSFTKILNKDGMHPSCFLDQQFCVVPEIFSV